MPIQNVRDLISKAKLGKALDALAKLPQVLNDDDNSTSVTMLNSQYSRSERENRMGLTTGDEHRRSMARITNAVLGLLNDFEDSNNETTTTISVTKGSSNVVTPTATPAVAPDDGITKILFLASNPSDTAKLQLETEYTRISTRLQEAQEPEKFPLKFKRAVTPSKFAEFLFLEKPDIVHFSGHGDQEAPEFQKLIGESRAGRPEVAEADDDQEAEAGIFLMDEDLRHAHFVSSSFLKHTFKNTVKRLNIPIKLVVFNACHSEEQAKVVSKIVPYVIGTSWSVKDNAAIAFATGFYFGIAQKMNVEDAFNFGIAQALAYNEPEDRFLLYKDGEKVEW